MEQLKQLLTAAGIAYKENEPLAAHCTFKIQVKFCCRRFFYFALGGKVLHGAVRRSTHHRKGKDRL